MPSNPDNQGIFSTPEQLQEIAKILKNYVRLPFSSINIPGAVMEGVLAHVRNATVLRTYDFIDVVDRRSRVGWQIKSTLAGTPVTWKRAKIQDSKRLIAHSNKTAEGRQLLGDAIIRFCNDHARESMEKENLDAIGYARLILHSTGKATYFERVLCTRENHDVFNASDFTWKWSKPKKTTKKEQLTALHGTESTSGKKWFAWHGKGENQLHFSGETAWWPAEGDPHAIAFEMPTEGERLSLEQFIDLLAASSNPLPPA